jgi:DNA adenine methylase
VRFVSPLRYPGGKGALATFLGAVISAQRPACTTYVEPYAGGAGAALRLLLDEYVDDVVLNDLDPGIAAFWRCVFDQRAEIVAKIRSVEVSIGEWHRQGAIYRAGTGDDLDLGFATFFLNRTNRSGILNARPIGGLNQTGKWLIDARFNRTDLTERIELISRYRNRVTLTEQDGTELLREMLPNSRSTFFYVDPPYVDKGEELYFNDLHWDDHAALAKVLTDSGARWLVTYNCDERIPSDLYPANRCVRFDIKHTAQKQHVGSEFAIFSTNLVVDSLDGLSTGDARFVG